MELLIYSQAVQESQFIKEMTDFDHGQVIEVKGS